MLVFQEPDNKKVAAQLDAICCVLFSKCVLSQIMENMLKGTPRNNISGVSHSCMLLMWDLQNFGEN